VTLVIVLAAALLLRLLFRDQPEMLVPVLTGLFGLGTGGLGGYGLARSR